MNYLKHYNFLINRGISRSHIDGYVEVHHILPTCMGGTYTSNNLVRLTPEEHYLAHLLLVKINPDISKLIYACMMMCSNRLGRQSNNSYGWIRRAFAKNIGISIKDRWARKYGFDDYITQTNRIWEMYTMEKISSPDIRKDIGLTLSNIRNSLKFFADMNDCFDVLKETDKYHKSVSMKQVRNNFTLEQETRRINAVKSMDYTERTSKTGSRKGKNNPTFGLTWRHEKRECPHCKIIVAGGRWHFDNCRSKKNEDDD
jgi:hypothetical protein